ncbi:uncharacterized protein EI90DRAFT_1912602 [Cantharellus anzutake]|uniref:uncharacterized protein n=1 Tax=Cantharellus anzutake TaxID=1750568 RepID=UPI001904F1C7|nr:uncharacterized protein EI90DRAFT_1912602 [Cantharellus anzutake]KAF8326613.1 hypothetical protein EI90DRAFT_1912602 [Cantharellus anzutake]
MRIEPCLQTTGRWSTGVRTQRKEIGMAKFGCGIPIQETLEQSASVSLTFRGTFAQAFLLSANTTSSADIFMDGRYQTTIDTWSNTSYSSCLYKYWNSSKLTAADHTITVTHRKLNGSHPNLEFVKYTYVSAPRKKGGLSLGAKIGIGIGISVALSITCGRASRNSRR